MGTRQLAAQGVVRALQNQVVVEDVDERRRSPRIAFFGGISVSALETYDTGDQVALVAAVTENISEEGLSFLCPKLLRVDTPLSIRFETLENRPVLKCAVRSVVFLGGEYHRIGTEFIE